MIPLRYALACNGGCAHIVIIAYLPTTNTPNLEAAQDVYRAYVLVTKGTSCAEDKLYNTMVEVVLSSIPD